MTKEQTDLKENLLMETSESMDEPLYMDQDRYIAELKATILDAASRCRNCNYCSIGCPLSDSTRGFISQSPSGLMQSVKYGIRWDMLENEDREDLRNLLYLCTTCNNCVLTCKAKATAIPILEIIQAGRNLLRELMIGPLPEQRKVLKDIYINGNPYGENPATRMDWLGDLAVKRLPQDQAEVLLFVGCTTSYDSKLFSLGRKMVQLLDALKVDFGVLSEETCCGHPARVIGDEALFQEKAAQNVDKFLKSGVKTIVTVSPHCYNTFVKEYPSIGQNIKVQHYTQFLAERIQKYPVKWRIPLPRMVTYHDPCYLGKHHRIYEEPRELLRAVDGIELAEMAQSRENSLCCGGGGGRMYTEVEDNPRLAETRVGQAIETGANMIATACPWCHTMLRNAVEDMDLQEKIEVKDIAEILFEAMGIN